MRRRQSDLTGATPMGADPRIPYDRTDPMVQVPTPQGPPPNAGGGLGGGAGMPPGGAPPDMGMGAPQGGGLASLYGGSDPGAQGGLPMGGLPQGDAGGLGAAGGSDQLTGDQLAQMGGQQGQGQLDPESAQVEEMQQLLDNPNTPPQVKDQIIQQLDLAARRQFGGLTA